MPAPASPLEAKEASETSHENPPDESPKAATPERRESERVITDWQEETRSVFWIRNGIFGSSAMEFRILRPLWWFGLLEARIQEKSANELVARRLYRKAPLSDCFAKFNVQIEGSHTRH